LRPAGRDIGDLKVVPCFPLDIKEDLKEDSAVTMQQEDF
jgi:hypothetical protein